MAIRVVKTTGNRGSGKIIFGSFLAIIFGAGSVASCKAYLADTEDSLIPMIVCAALAFAGIFMIMSGIRRNRKQATVFGSAEDPEKILEMLRNDPDSLHSHMENMMCQGVSGTYRVTRTSTKVTRTTLDGTTTTTETTEHTTNGFSGEETQKEPVVTVTCQACGGLTQLKLHEVGACRFCGSKIRS